MYFPLPSPPFNPASRFRIPKTQPMCPKAHGCSVGTAGRGLITATGASAPRDFQQPLEAGRANDPWTCTVMLS